jgi:hypothetical protein
MRGRRFFILGDLRILSIVLILLFIFIRTFFSKPKIKELFDSNSFMLREKGNVRERSVAGVRNSMYPQVIIFFRARHFESIRREFCETMALVKNKKAFAGFERTGILSTNSLIEGDGFR